jgi:hypothetical protein
VTELTLAPFNTLVAEPLQALGFGQEDEFLPWPTRDWPVRKAIFRAALRCPGGCPDGPTPDEWVLFLP